MTIESLGPRASSPEGAGQSSKSARLGHLLEEWRLTYPEKQRAEFWNDGILDEAGFAAAKSRILYVVLEPNSGVTARFENGHVQDMKIVLTGKNAKKPFSKNLALWTSTLLDEDGDAAPDRVSILKRVAVMNLKKLGGRGTADEVRIAWHAGRDRDCFRKELEIIEPSIVIACGKLVVRILRMAGDAGPPGTEAIWHFAGFPVIDWVHPSRPGPDASLNKLKDLAGIAVGRRPAER